MKKVLLVLTGIGTALLAASILKAREPEVAAAPPTLKTSTSTNTKVSVEHVAAEGRLVTYPGAEVVVGAESTGRLVRMLASEGQKVAKGDLLAELAVEDVQ